MDRAEAAINPPHPRTDVPPVAQRRNAAFRHSRSLLVLLLASCASSFVVCMGADVPDLIVSGGRIVTGRVDGAIHEAMAVRGGRILATGRTSEIARLADSSTQVIDLKGAMVLPGLYEPHVHPRSVQLAYLQDPYQELRSIREIQDWIRQRAGRFRRGNGSEFPGMRSPARENAGIRPSRSSMPPAPRTRWFSTLRVVTCSIAADSRSSALPPRHDPVLRRPVRGSPETTLAGFRTKAAAPDRFPAGKSSSVPTASLNSSSQVRRRSPASSPPSRTWTEQQAQQALLTLHRAYQAAGITTIFERGESIDDYRAYDKLKAAGLLSIRARFTLLNEFKTGKDVEDFVRKENIRPGYGDDWLSIGTLKILADGGIHWGNTYLSEPYGPKRARFYVQSDPAFRGEVFYSVDQMKDIFGAGFASAGKWQSTSRATRAWMPCCGRWRPWTRRLRSKESGFCWYMPIFRRRRPRPGLLLSECASTPIRTITTWMRRSFTTYTVPSGRNASSAWAPGLVRAYPSFLARTIWSAWIRIIR